MSESSPLRTWVRSTFGADAAPLDALAVANDGFDSLLLARGPGSEPGEFSADEFAASRWIEREGGEIVFGTAPCERGPGEELGLRLTNGSIVWTAGEPLPSEPRTDLSRSPEHRLVFRLLVLIRARRRPHLEPHAKTRSQTANGRLNAPLPTALCAPRPRSFAAVCTAVCSTATSRGAATRGATARAAAARAAARLGARESRDRGEASR